MNKKGFTLVETLVVVVFLVTIFTFVYASIIPLVGKYTDIAEREENIDIVYKLYSIRKMILNSQDMEYITGEDVRRILCEDLTDKDYCLNLMDKLGLVDYELLYVYDAERDIDTINSINSEIGKYIIKQKNTKGIIILLDKNSHTIAHLKYKRII